MPEIQRLRAGIASPPRPESLEDGIVGVRSSGGRDGVSCCLRLLDSASPATRLEVYTYDTLPAWRLIAIDDTVYISAFSEDREGHESALYKIVPTEVGPLYRSFRRMFEEMRQQAVRII